MKKTAVKDLIPGMLVNRDVLSGDGVVLLEKGTRLTAWQIANLRHWPIPHIYIADGPPAAPDAAPAASFFGEYVRTVDAIRHAFEHIRIFREVPVLEMEELAEERIPLLAETVGVLDYLYEIRLHSQHTFQHSLNVAIIAAIIGRWQKYQGVEIKNLILSALLHDIGKLFVPLSVLDKPGALTPAEFAIIQKHPLEGYKLLESDPRVAESVKAGILQHHERLDGSGYPHRLDAGQIHGYAKIIAIADIYNAMTSDRAYRPKMTPLVALETIAGQMHEKLATDLCITFLDNMRECFTGNSVLLSTGELAKIVVLNNRDRFWSKPIVRADDGKMLDLQKEQIDIVDLIEEL